MRKKTQAVAKKRRAKRLNKILLNLLIVVSGALVLRVGFLYGYSQDTQSSATQSASAQRAVHQTIPLPIPPTSTPPVQQTRTISSAAPQKIVSSTRSEGATVAAAAAQNKNAKIPETKKTLLSTEKKPPVGELRTAKRETAAPLKKQTPSRSRETHVKTEIAKELEAAAKKPLHETEEIGTLLDNYFGHRGKIKEFPPGWPVEEGYISSIFGKRASGRLHKGVDIVSARGTPIFAVAGGLVTRSGRLGGYGRLVEIQHSGGYFTRYAHNSKNLVEVGDKVARGQRIALVGASGNATTHHVHFELRRGKEALNPVPYLFGKTPGLPKEVQMLSAKEQTGGRH